MWLGFGLAAYSVVGNDVIQTLGTFLNSNSSRPWWVLWIYAGSILTIVLVYGWYVNGGDISYGRLELIPQPQGMGWIYVLPPLTLLILTRIGIPVSTTFLILSFFSTGTVIWKMVFKSVIGYAVAFATAIIIYNFVINKIEKKFFQSPDQSHINWVVAQWFSTGFLWSQWLIQDLANIYVYLPRALSLQTLVITLVVILGLLCYIFYISGGAIQNIVRSKTNTADIRSATIIDFLFGIILLIFKEWNNLPMSTTWVFIGLLAGREYAMNYQFHKKIGKATNRIVITDFLKVAAGLVVSVLLVFLLKWDEVRDQIIGLLN